MSKKQRLEKWKRVGESGGVGILEKARARLRAMKPKGDEQSSNPPKAQPAAQTVPPASKQPVTSLPQRAPSKVVKPAQRPASRPSTRPATTLPSNIDSGNAARAIAAFRQEQRRKLPPKGIFTAPQPGLKRVMPIPVHAPPPPLQQYRNPLANAYWSYIPAMREGNPVSGLSSAPSFMMNPLHVPQEERVAELVRLHEQYQQTGEIGGLPIATPKQQRGPGVARGGYYQWH